LSHPSSSVSPPPQSFSCQSCDPFFFIHSIPRKDRLPQPSLVAGAPKISQVEDDACILLFFLKAPLRQGNWFLAAPAERASLAQLSPQSSGEIVKRIPKRCQGWPESADMSDGCRSGYQTSLKSPGRPRLVKVKIMKKTQPRPKRPSELLDRRDEAGEACRRRR